MPFLSNVESEKESRGLFQGTGCSCEETGLTQTCRCPVHKAVSPVISASEMENKAPPRIFPRVYVNCQTWIW